MLPVGGDAGGVEVAGGGVWVVDGTAGGDGVRVPEGEGLGTGKGLVSSFTAPLIFHFIMSSIR